MKTILLFLFAFSLFHTASAEDTTQQTLPSVKIKTLDGSSVNIRDFSHTGRITVLFFWETYCGPSIKALDNMLELYADWQTKYQCELVGVNMDDARNSSKVKPLVNGKGWPYTFLTDENKDLTRALNIPNCPYVILLNRKGQIIYRHNGFGEGFENELEEQLKKL